MEQEHFEVGQTITCQFGNPGDSSGYRESQECIIRDIVSRQFLGSANIFPTNYLVEIPGENYLGDATLAPRNLHPEDDQVQVQLYCTNARTYGPENRFGFYTRDDAVRSLGY